MNEYTHPMSREERIAVECFRAKAQSCIDFGVEVEATPYQGYPVDHPDPGPETDLDFDWIAFNREFS